ncbi:hypothetical protein B0H14DRAFT_3444932 [Mycena olivaceomarginata]|nr:hypothetical protein B0H14DRAFT_3444932 [Mycena olivaceomarginata]
MRTSGPNLDYRRPSSIKLPGRPHIFRDQHGAANVYKGNGPTKILMKMILIKGWDGRVQYHVTQFKIPGGVLNILDLTSIITSKGAMVLCARVALMCAVCLSTTDLAYYCYEVAGNVKMALFIGIYSPVQT